MTIAPSFDYEFYAKGNRGFRSQEEAYEHFLREGKEAGLKGSPGCDQGYFLRMIQHIKPQSVLELGPGAAPKLIGPNVFYFDVKTADELRDRYRNDGCNEAVPREIHFVEPNGDMSIIDRKFDVVFSAHVIEHTPDLVMHLMQIESLLNEGGYYFLVVPNKKFTFDYFKPRTVLEDVVAAHLDPNGAETIFLRSFLLEEFRRTHNTARTHWIGDHGAPRGISGNIDQVRTKYEGVKSRPVARSGYHRWIFDEDAFVEVINGLYTLGISPLRVNQCYNTITNSLSFNAILSR
ncbi:hypothetical protein RHIZO_02374 [Rhizobiaceae bacterium]|nr:hypothetical protein RHIZO_02374 [Rhizobiaceae bacterium]